MKLEMLKEMLSGRLVKKHFTRHFRRLAILEMFTSSCKYCQWIISPGWWESCWDTPS